MTKTELVGKRLLLAVLLSGSLLVPSQVRAQAYPTTAWSQVPPAIATATGYRAGYGTGVTQDGQTVQLRPGSPFVKIGERLLQLSNVPFQRSGEFHVPDELFADPAFAAHATPAAEAEPAASDGLPPVVAGQRTRRPGPWRVVIDPGHGGRHPGTSSPRSGVQEKHLTLAVSKLIHDELSRMDGIEPILTRTSDAFVDIPDRPLFAVEREGDLFVSIHIDAQPRGSSARGFTTYYLGAARTETGRQAAMRENTVPGADASRGPNIDQLEFILAGLDQGLHLRESVRFGGFIQNRLRDVVDSPDRGVRPGPYWVLVRATSNMPTVLVELGFITNAEEERRLRDPAHHREMARAIAVAIRDYLADKSARLSALGSAE